MQILIRRSGERGYESHDTPFPQWICLGAGGKLARPDPVCLQVTFRTVQQLMEVRKQLTPFVRRNSNKPTAAEAYNAFAVQERSNTVNLKVLTCASSQLRVGRYKCLAAHRSSSK